MDFSVFSNDNFNVKDWINVAFKQSEAATNKDAHAAQMVVKLQLFIQEVNSALEETSQQVLQNLPRVVRDAETVRQEALLIKTQMKMVKEEIANVECGTTQCMQNLLTVDAIKCRMQMASKALQEADNWKTLSSDVEDLFQTGDTIAISNKIVGMQQCLKILVDIPDYKDRCLHLENLKNRLEAMLSPQLVSAFNTMSIDAVHLYVKLFKDMDRLGELKTYYYKCQKGIYLAKWKSLIESDTDDGVFEWLTNYYDILLSSWHVQVKWCSQVFPGHSYVQIVCELFCNILSNLDPSVAFCIDKALKLQAQPLLFLIELKQVTERFSQNIDAAVQIHDQITPEQKWVKDLAKVIYLPYKGYISKYKSYEEKLLEAHLDTLHLSSGSITRCVSSFSESISKIFTFANDACNRCCIFTNGIGFPDICKVLKMLFVNYLEKIQKMITNWKSLKSEEKFDITGEEWTTFQQLLHAVQSCGDLMIRLESLEQSLMSSFLKCSKKFGCLAMDEKKESNSAFSTLDVLLLDSLDREILKKFAGRVLGDDDFSFLPEAKKGSITLCEKFLKYAYETIFLHIQRHLSNLPMMKVWTQENPTGALTVEIPMFGLSPQEYITQIGQYLMTLPQHIEPFVLQDNNALNKAIENSQLPYSYDKELESGTQLADILLSCMANETTKNYIDSILKINRVTTYSAKQLSVDIDYLGNVLDDLGLHPSKDLLDLSIMFKAPALNFEESTFGKSSHIASRVKDMRNIK